MQPPAQTTKMVTADGKMIATFYRGKPGADPAQEDVPVIKDAIIAIEDSRFYGHGGIDPRAFSGH